MHQQISASKQNCTRSAGTLLWLLMCMVRCTAAVPPCVSPIMAKNCFALETLLGRTDWSMDNFNNSEEEWHAFVSNYMTDDDGFPYETNMTMKQHEMTVFLTNWAMEPRYNTAINMVSKQNNGAVRTPRELQEDHTKMQEWLSSHGPRRVYKPKSTLEQFLSEQEQDDITNNKATHLRFRARFHSPIPKNTVISRQECQDAIDSSAIFSDTVTQGIRAAAMFDENDDQHEHVMPALAIRYRCIGVVMQHVTAKEDALVSPYDMDYNSVTAQNVTSSAAGQSQALLYIALYTDNCLWDGKTRVLLDNIYASVSENIATADSSSALVTPAAPRVDIWPEYAGRMAGVLGMSPVRVGAGVRTDNLQSPDIVWTSHGLAAQVQSLTYSTSVFRLSYTPMFLDVFDQARSTLQRGFASVLGIHEAEEHIDLYLDADGAYVKRTRLENVFWPENVKNYDCSQPPCQWYAALWSLKCPRGFKKNVDHVYCEDSTCFKPACSPCAMHTYDNAVPSVLAGPASAVATIDWEGIVTNLLKGHNQTLVQFKGQNLRMRYQSRDAQNLGLFVQSYVNSLVGMNKVPYPNNGGVLINITSAAVLDTGFLAAWTLAGKPSLRIVFLEPPVASTAADTVCIPCPAGTYTVQQASTSENDCVPVLVSSNGLPISRLDIDYLYDVRDVVCRQNSPSDAIEASAIVPQGTGGDWELQLYQRGQLNNTTPSIPPAPGGMNFVPTNSILIPRFDDSLLALFAHVTHSRTPETSSPPPQQRSLRSVSTTFVGAEKYHQNSRERRNLLVSTSTQASGAVEGGIMYTYTPNSAPASTPPASATYFWDAAPWVTRYVMIGLVGLVFILCIAIAAITLKHKCDLEHTYHTQYAYL